MATFGAGLAGQVLFDESPSMVISTERLGSAELIVDATYTQQQPNLEIHCRNESQRKLAQRLGEGGGIAVLRGRAGGESGPRSAGRMVLIGPHFELTDGAEQNTKGRVVAGAVRWALGR